MPGAFAPGCKFRHHPSRHRSRVELQEEQAFRKDSVQGRFGPSDACGFLSWNPRNSKKHGPGFLPRKWAGVAAP